MTELIKVKYDLTSKVLEYEGPLKLLEPAIEQLSKLGKIKEGDAIATNFIDKKAQTLKKSKKKTEELINSKSENKKSKKSGSTRISAEKFDIYGNGIDVPTLADFFAEKKPGRSPEKIAVVAYYITEILGEKSFSDGNIEYAFKMLKVTRANHLRQTITNAKNKEDWFDKFEETQDWELTRGGELLVSDNLPPKEA